MTRINVVPPSELTDKHLVAEYRELPRMASFAASKLERVGIKFQAPKTYRLGKGHMDFFVKKGMWLWRRHKALVAEMRHRGFVVNFPEYPSCHPVIWMRDWEPDEQAFAINRARIQERLTSVS